MNDTTFEELARTENIAETLAREMKSPVIIKSAASEDQQMALLPPGWTTKYNDDIQLRPTPRRKIAAVELNDADSFIDYIKRHGSLAYATVWCDVDYRDCKVNFLSILNDHGEDEDKPAWRDHTAKFLPEYSEEFQRWTGSDKKLMSQIEFAMFIEDNMSDITSHNGSASGVQMLDMALQFEANQDARFKSFIRLQSGGVEMAFIDKDDDATIQKMQMFDRFNIGIPVFWSGDAYRIEVRLRYRVREGRLTFWYELLRHDKALEDATKTMIQTIKEKTGVPFFFGKPF